MKFIASVLAITALTACSSVAKPDASPCTALQLDCTGSKNILIVGNAEEHDGLLKNALAASEKFQTTFDRAPAKIVIVPGGVITAKQNDVFKAAGYTSLPWISASDKAKLRKSSIIRQVEEQTKGLPQSVKDSAMKQSLAAVKSRTNDTHASAVQAGAFAHELGHMWFINAFKPANAEAQKGHAYGGWAPDWLDETAAVLLENSTLNKRRRESFSKLNFEEIIPLRTFLTMEHPAAQAAKDLLKTLPSEKMKGASSESRAIVLTGEEAREFLKNSGGNKTANFYAQVQVFTDFLLSYSNDTKVFVSLTEALLAGGTTETWLSSQDWGLPSTVAELDTAWLAWIDKDSG